MAAGSILDCRLGRKFDGPWTSISKFGPIRRSWIPPSLFKIGTNLAVHGSLFQNLDQFGGPWSPASLFSNSDQNGGPSIPVLKFGPIWRSMDPSIPFLKFGPKWRSMDPYFKIRTKMVWSWILAGLGSGLG